MTTQLGTFLVPFVPMTWGTLPEGIELPEGRGQQVVAPHHLLPENCPTEPLVLGWRAVTPDLRSKHGHRDYVGWWTVCDPAEIRRDNRGACPDAEGDGVCIAHNYEGAASGGVPCSTVAIVAYRSADLLGPESFGVCGLGGLPSKVRTSARFVVGVVDFARLLRAGHGRDADLSDADLSDADLHNANLSNADLSNANLRYADLYGANLSNADLYNADLSDADLHNANLHNANLYDADLSGANLSYANLRHADLPAGMTDDDVRTRGAIR